MTIYTVSDLNRPTNALVRKHIQPIYVEVYLNKHVLNKIIHTQNLLRVIDRKTQSSGRSIKGGCPWVEVLCHAHKHGGSNFEKEPAHTQH